MSQRNPLNERNTVEGAKKGVAKKSASSAKPKREVAGSVTVVTKVKSKKQKREEKDRIKEKQRRTQQRFYNPPTQEYKMARRIWWVVIALAILGAVGAWIASALSAPMPVVVAILILSYVCIALALYIDLVKIRKMRKEYAATMEGSKALSRIEKKERAEERAREKEEERHRKETGEKKHEEFNIISIFRK